MIDMVLILMYAVVMAALGAVVWAVVHRWRQHDRSAAISNGIPVRRILLGVGGGLAVCLLLTFLLGSSQPMRINGANFADTLWLKAADMFVNTSFVLLVIAVIMVICSNVRNIMSRR